MGSINLIKKLSKNVINSVLMLNDVIKASDVYRKDSKDVMKSSILASLYLDLYNKI